jgi:hypothetical protein
MPGAPPGQSAAVSTRATLDAVFGLWAGDYEHHGQHWSFRHGDAQAHPASAPTNLDCRPRPGHL